MASIRDLLPPSPLLVAGADPALLLSLPREAWHPLEQGTAREWLEANGRGDYAALPLVLCPTRRYHGLLVALPPGRDRRHVFLSRFEETLQRPERSFPLSTGRYPGVWNPTGYGSLESFALAPHPTWLHRIGRTDVTREVLLVEGEPTVLVRYRVASVREDIELRLRPLLPFREADALTFENLALDPRVERLPTGIRVRPYAELPALTIAVGGAVPAFEADPCWYRQVELREEIARGYPGLEDSFCPGWFSVPLRPGREVVVVATIGEPPADPVALFAAEAERRRTRAAARSPGVRGVLEVAADAFLARLPTGRLAVEAGYPWFREWGRDTAIALPGLLLARGRVEEMGEALAGLTPYLVRGLLPNVFGPDPRSSDYGSADASLFFARAVRLHRRAGGDPALLADRLLPALKGVAAGFLAGDAPGVRVDREGLPVVGEQGRALTWMDARVEGRPVTPREGTPVEIAALWYELLDTLVATTSGKEARTWRALRKDAGRAFVDRFWLAEPGYLADVWRDGAADRTVRPNMVIAAALEASPLRRAQRLGVVARAEQELLTPYGLRTLTPRHPDYRGAYEGGVEARDRAYHQGTVWPWLLGFYAEALLRARGTGRAVLRRLSDVLAAFEPHLAEAGIGQVSEVFDGDPPHRPGGAIAQAWSVAELLRVARMIEEKAP